MADNRTNRRLIASYAAHVSWAKTDDRSARTQAARDANRDRFLKIVDPDGVLDPVVRAQRAESARKAHYARMALNSVKARRERAARKAAEAEGQK